MCVCVCVCVCVYVSPRKGASCGYRVFGVGGRGLDVRRMSDQHLILGEKVVFDQPMYLRKDGRKSYHIVCWILVRLSYSVLDSCKVII